MTLPAGRPSTMRTAILAVLLVAVAMPALAAEKNAPVPATKPVTAKAAASTGSTKPANAEKEIGVAPVLGSSGTLGVPPPAAGLLPNADDLIKSGRALNDEEDGDLAFGAFQRGLYLTAFTIAMSRAQRGDGAASTLLGRLYAEGLGVKQSDKAAAAWYQQGALAGDPNAQLALGLLYLDGKGLKKDRAKAADAFEQAAEWDEPQALYNLGLLYLEGKVRPRDSEKAASLFSKSAGQGNVDAQFALAQLYAEGEGVLLDDGISTMWIAKAAKAGHPDAAVEYGIRLFNGTGSKKDIIAAAGWFRRAAESGNVVGQNRYARILASGMGADPDPIGAAKWHYIASKRGAKDPWLDDFVAKLSDADRKAAETAAERWAAGH